MDILQTRAKTSVFLVQIINARNHKVMKTYENLGTKKTLLMVIHLMKKPSRPENLTEVSGSINRHQRRIFAEELSYLPQIKLW